MDKWILSEKRYQMSLNLNQKGEIMGFELLLGLLGGLALFLYGMQMMSTNLEAAAGNKMKQILERLTSNRFLGV